MKATKCLTCQHQSVIYRRRIGAKQVELLRQLDTSPIPRNLSDVQGVTASNYPDFQRLRYWGLIMEVDQGKWKTTLLAKVWLDGVLAIPAWIWVLNGNVVQEVAGHVLDSAPRVHVDQIRAPAGKPFTSAPYTAKESQQELALQ